MPLVSIITPSYNQAAYLEQTIQSVLSQDYPLIEYILVDGDSTDGSLEIIHKYTDRFAYWVSEPDSGQAEAINKGFSHAHGEIVAWLNSDDLYLPEAISQAVAALQANPQLGMVYADAVTIGASGHALSELRFADYSLLDLMGFRIICQPAVFMRRAVLGKAGALDTSYHFLLDHQLWLRLAHQAPIQHVTATWAAARHHLGAKNVAHAAGFGEEAFRILAWMNTQPDFAPLVVSHRRRIEAGAYRLQARYLLDGGIPGSALRSYAMAFWRSPRFTLQHWHRIIYAMLSLLGARGLAAWYYRLKRSSRSPAIASSTPPTHLE
jgi:glycosyltransferase involved in cell wall biosynthesis